MKLFMEYSEIWVMTNHHSDVSVSNLITWVEWKHGFISAAKNVTASTLLLSKDGWNSCTAKYLVKVGKFMYPQSFVNTAKVETG